MIIRIRWEREEQLKNGRRESRKWGRGINQTRGKRPGGRDQAQTNLRLIKKKKKEQSSTPLML